MTALKWCTMLWEWQCIVASSNTWFYGRSKHMRAVQRCKLVWLSSGNRLVQQYGMGTGTRLSVDLRLVRQPGGEVTHRDLIPVGVPELRSYGPGLLHQRPRVRCTGSAALSCSTLTA